MYLKNRSGPRIWLRQTSNPIKRKICKLKWFQLREKCIITRYSQLSPCGHLAIMDTPIIPTAAESLAKNYRHFDWNKTPNITDLQAPLLVPTRISISTFRHFGRIISVYNIFLPLPLFVPVTLVEKWTFWFPFKMIPSIKLPYLLQGSMLRPVGSLLWPAFTLSGD